MNATGAPIEPSTALICRPVSSRAAFSGVAAASIRSSATRERPVEVGVPQVRHHVVVEDRLALAVGQERRLEAWSGVELHLAVLEGRVDVEEDRQAVVEARAARRPTGR